MGRLIADIIEWTLKLLNRGGDEIARGSEKLINNADQLAGGTIRASYSGIHFFGLLYENGPLVIAWIIVTIIIAWIMFCIIVQITKNKEFPFLDTLSVILPVIWILASLNFGYNSLVAKNDIQSAEYREEIYRDILEKKDSGDLKSIKYIDDGELILRHSYVSSCFRSLLKNYDRFENYKNNRNSISEVFLLDNINRFLDQKIGNIKNELAEDDLKFFDEVMGQRTIDTCRFFDIIHYYPKLR